MKKMDILNGKGCQKLLEKLAYNLRCRSESLNMADYYNEKINQLKRSLLPYLRLATDNTLYIEKARIVLKTDQIKRTLQRERTLAYIERKYGKDVATDIDDNCTVDNLNESIYNIKKEATV